MFHKVGSLAVLSCAMVWSQEPSTEAGPRLTAREIFYGAKPATPPPPAPVAAVKKPAPPSSNAKKLRDAVEQASSRQTHAGVDATVPVRLANDSVSEGGGLAMRWTITQMMPDGNKKEVPTTKAFKSGDKINVRVEVNDFGYLYILARGSSGKWSPLFPSPEISGGDNRVGPNMAYTIPAGFVFKFDEQPGEERIFIVFSRKPEPDFDGLIYKVAPDRKQRPELSPTAPIRPAPGIILASNTSFGDPFIDRIRTMSARDLIVEKVEGEQKSSIKGPRFEHAAYVASKRSDDPRVTAEVTLTHQ